MTNTLRAYFVLFLTLTIGNLLVYLRPKKVKELTDKGISLVINNNLSSTERLMRRAILKKLENKKEHTELSKLHRAYWKNQGDEFVNVTERNLENTHLPNYKFVFDLLKVELKNSNILFDKFIEIGTGNGAVLNYCASQFLDVKEFVGIDLSPKQIETNKITYSNNTKLEFVAADAIEWLKNEQKGNKIFLTFRGVLEYFTQNEVNDFFSEASELGNIVFIAIEPIAENHDFNKQFQSQVYGFEGAFSHNYIKLFENAEYKLWHHELKQEEGHSNAMSINCAKNF